MSRAAPIPRKAHRRPLDLRARIRAGHGLAGEVSLSDISEDGCCIAFKSQFVEAGQTIVIQPSSLEGLVGRVVWAIHGRAGIQFARPLYGPVVEHLHRNNRALAVVGG